MKKRFQSIDWPEGKSFAFTVFDDTDNEDAFNVRPLYDFLYDQGFCTTKSVWPIEGFEVPTIGGATCEDPTYLKWVQELQSRGFEIALHNATFCSSWREQTARGVEEFYRLFGHYPFSLANHADCREAIYWGENRITGSARLVYNVLQRFKYRNWFQGQVEDSPFFWGDICSKKISYVRNFVFGDINTLRACPYMPYHDPRRPYVNYWFASSEGHNLKSFLETISEKNQDRLEAERGACIMYTHFASGFISDGALHPQFRRLMHRLSERGGWFVPVHTLLDFLRQKNEGHQVTLRQLRALEWKWLLHKVRVGGTT